MPKATATSGSSNRWAAEGEPGYAPPADEVAPTENVQPHVQETVQEEPVPDVPEPEPAQEGDGDDSEPDYAAYSVRDLVELCRARGLAFSSGSGMLAKADLVARLTEYEASHGEAS